MLAISAAKEIFESLKSSFDESIVPSKLENFPDTLEITRCFALNPISECIVSIIHFAIVVNLECKVNVETLNCKINQVFFLLKSDLTLHVKLKLAAGFGLGCLFAPDIILPVYPFFNQLGSNRFWSFQRKA